MAARLREVAPGRLPSIDGLLAFDAAARAGTFERAAQELNLTASAVAKRVATVEALLGAPLFERRTRSLTLTATGKEYLAQVREALGLLAAMPLHQRATQRQQRLRVSSPPTFARQVLVPQLGAYAQAEPEVELEVVLSVPYLEVPLPRCDVEVFHGPSPSPQATCLMEEALWPLAAPALLQRAGPLRHPADLLRLPLLRTPIEPWRTWFDAWGLQAPEPDQGPRLVDLGLVLAAAQTGQGVALARPCLALEALERGALVPALPHSARPAQQYLARTHGRSAAAGRFVQWLQQACQRQAARAHALLSA